MEAGLNLSGGLGDDRMGIGRTTSDLPGRPLVPAVEGFLPHGRANSSVGIVVRGWKVGRWRLPTGRNCTTPHPVPAFNATRVAPRYSYTCRQRVPMKHHGKELAC